MPLLYKALDTDTGEEVLVLEPGGGGAESPGHVHHQVVESAEWVVNHNFGYKPSVSVLIDGVTEAEALVTHSSTNQTRIQFLTPCMGSARLI